MKNAACSAVKSHTTNSAEVLTAINARYIKSVCKNLLKKLFLKPLRGYSGHRRPPMTNTTQLLQDAAKAAGYKSVQYDNWPGMDVRYGYSYALFVSELGEYWNPIESDADAFRLMVRIKKLSADNPIEWDDQPQSLQWCWVEFIDALESGDEARCRVAITTLAAEMHRAAQSQEVAE